MPANRLSRPAPRQQLVTGSLIDGSPSAVSRLISDVSAAHQELAKKIAVRTVVVADLVVGANRISHGLGRPSRGATVSPTVADASFAFAHAPDGDLVAVITVVGVGQPGATVELY